VPEFNSLIAFRIPRYHEVTAVTVDRARYSIFGWFLTEGILYDLYKGEVEEGGSGTRSDGMEAGRVSRQGRGRVATTKSTENPIDKSGAKIKKAVPAGRRQAADTDTAKKKSRDGGMEVGKSRQAETLRTMTLLSAPSPKPLRARQVSDHLHCDHVTIYPVTM